ncbi:transglutaminase-like domain-containing protein [Pannonibacter carbonis]|uniref:transglutaminase-like domain-containing protein n=1 Tax=Pannonibacter carbonis TaxID=2067569 RepID=UPI001300883E|nr:transglutaminase-like domain-containing protein [Pannonibacter carbonis]
MPHVTFTLTEPANSASHLLFGIPFDTPEQTVQAIRVNRGKNLGLVRARNSGQMALLIAPDDGAAEVEVQFSDEASAFPQWLFTSTGGAHETPSQDLAALMRTLLAADATPAEHVSAIVRHVDERFEYGVRDIGLADDTDAMPALACDTHLGTCVDTHSYAVAAMRAGGIEAAYVSGIFFPEGADVSAPGHCWFVVNAASAPHHWDISHHLKHGLGPTTPAYNPKPGTRFALTAGRDLVFSLPEHDVTATILKGFVDASRAEGHFLQTSARLT